MNESILSRERILETAEDVLRRYGPTKATVLDVARALGVSHGSVYRHFASKAALRDEVVRRWLDATMPPLAAIAAENGPAVERLRRWLDQLIATKRGRAAGDADLFAAYLTLAGDSGAVVRDHIEQLTGQLAVIVEQGAVCGEFSSRNARETARALLNATARFHNPVHARGWQDPEIDAEFEAVWRLLLSGIQAR